ncbi:MAG: lipopolysaccharide heptosyltransferase I [Acidobacteria bacterium 13_1_20CM_3_53_8]|nr:MAG: lipopolysaccharide heptosyltransferase I [Acidobacteria bacterium 13_1_20CM_3_53_8]
MRVLIVRLSSMGDVVQTLPAITDAARSFPEARFDWVVDESFAQVPAWHRSVDAVMPSGLRRWGRNFRNSFRSGEVGAFLKRLREHRYDFVVDLQGEFKSAMIARLAKGRRAGHDRQSAHEWGAHLAYNRRFAVPKGQHSIERMRQLLARALSYSYDESEIDYGIDRSRLPLPPIALPEPFLVFIHSTSWESKNWPELYWRDLTTKATRAGFHIVLPWGTERERERSLRIANGNSRVTVLPELSISEKASIIARAHATVGLDTGLSHIAAALDIPSVTLYGATDPQLVGATGKNQIQVASGFECVKCHETECRYQHPSEFKPACFVEISPERIWSELQTLVEEKASVTKI